MIIEISYLILPLLVMAILYSSVGHGGASGYIAVMTLMGVSVVDIRVIALAMNIAVSFLVVVRFTKHGHLNWRLFLPLAIASIPMAYIGGSINTSTLIIKVIVGISLFIAAIYIFLNKYEIRKTRKPHIINCILIGLILGYISGLTGVGGAIYLSPIIYFMKWSDMHENAAVSGAFVFVNSLAGMIGYLSTNTNFPIQSLTFVMIAALGGIIGTFLGINKFQTAMMRKVLSLILFVAGGKLIMSSVI